MKPLLDLLPAFVFIGVFAWAEDHPAMAAALAGTTFAGMAPWADQLGIREAPVLVATAAALLLLLAQTAWWRWRRGDARQAVSLRTRVVLLAPLALLALALGGTGSSRWTPSALYWTLGLVLWLARVMMQRNLMRSLLSHRIDLPDLTWQRLNAAWVGFFGLVGLAHLWAAYSLPPSAWGAFKSGGGLAMLVAFGLLQWLYLSRRTRALAAPTPAGGA